MKRFVKELIKRIEKETGLSGYAIAKEVGLSTQQYYNYKSGKTRSMNFKNLCKLVKVSGMSWLEVGKILEKEYL